MDVEAYLARIRLSADIEVTPDGLEKLQRAHLTAVPFENLDVFHKRGVQTSIGWSVPKVVARRRGGWCYELNGAFSALLTALGFEVKQLGATVSGDPPSPVPDHLTLEVTLDRPYLVDVGFGDSFIRPLPLDSEGPHDGGVGDFWFQFQGDGTTLLADGEGGRKPEYRFGTRPMATGDFDEPSEYLQTEPGLRWTTTPFATRLIDGGPDRVTLLSDRLKIRREGVWTEAPVDPESWAALLDHWFGMTP